MPDKVTGQKVETTGKKYWQTNGFSPLTHTLVFHGNFPIIGFEIKLVQGLLVFLRSRQPNPPLQQD
jgi:hypothetical protein